MSCDSYFLVLCCVTSFNTHPHPRRAIGCPTALKWRTTPWSAHCAWSRWRLMTSTSSPAPAATRSAASVGTASAQMKTASAPPAERWGNEINVIPEKLLFKGELSVMEMFRKEEMMILIVQMQTQKVNEVLGSLSSVTSSSVKIYGLSSLASDAFCTLTTISWTVWVFQWLMPICTEQEAGGRYIMTIERGNI